MKHSSGKVVLSNDTVRRLMLDLGGYIRIMRVKQGLTQRGLAAKVGVTDNHVSDIENGIRKISPERYRQFAEALGQDRAEFGKRVLLHYDPFTYREIFGGKRVEDILSGVPERIQEAIEEARMLNVVSCTS